MTDQTVEELEKQLAEYNEQLEIVDAALQETPDSSDFLEVKANLLDVQKVTKDLLQLKRDTEEVDVQYKKRFAEVQETAQHRGLFVGKEIQAKYAADGKFYKAKIESITEKGFGIKYEGYNETAFLNADEIKEKAAKEVVMIDSSTPGAAAMAKSTDKFVVDETGQLIVPQFMKILPTDSEKVRVAKKRRIKSYKSEYRLQKSETKLKRKKSSWQDFQNKGRKTKRLKKSKPSIFQSPDTIEGKVGVIGSGAEMTKFTVQKYTPKSLQGNLPQTKIQGENPWAKEDPDAKYLHRH